MGCCASRSRQNRRLPSAYSTEGPLTVLVPSKSSHAYAASALPPSILETPFTRGQAALESSYAPSHVEHAPSHGHAPSHQDHFNHAPHEQSHGEFLTPQDALTHYEHATSYAPSLHEQFDDHLPSVYEQPEQPPEQPPDYPPDHPPEQPFDHPPDHPPPQQERSIGHASSHREEPLSHTSSRRGRTASHTPSQHQKTASHTPSNQEYLMVRSPSAGRDRATVRTQRLSYAPETENDPDMSHYEHSIAPPREDRSREIPQSRDRGIVEALQHLGHTRLHALKRPDCYPRGSRPSFRSAYARAVRRYGFDSGKHAGFGMRNNAVCKVMHTREIEHEVPAESIQNGEIALLSPWSGGDF